MTSNPSRRLINDIEALLATSARLFASEGSVREVALLANAEYSINLCEEQYGQNTYHLYLQVPDCLYSQNSDDLIIETDRSFYVNAPKRSIASLA
ncbi:hypothetical protein [Microcoleus sp.]|uniref:hypothetical protein n=1 Tax=Microcoleus sp. TaxID=44472 RepID=UPI0035249539